MSFTAFKAFGDLLGQWPKSVTISGKLVFCALAHHHNHETGRCDPSLETLAEELGISVRAVRDGLRSLEKAKLIETVHRTVRTGNGKRNLTNRYRLLGAAKSAGGVRQDLPTNQELYSEPSAWDDLSFVIEGADVEDPSQEDDRRVVRFPLHLIPGSQGRVA